MKAALTLAALLALAAVARADAPTADAVKAALPKWTDAIAVPFTYQGLRYENDDYKKVTACDKAFGAHGVVKDAKKLPQFVDVPRDERRARRADGQAGRRACTIRSHVARARQHRARRTPGRRSTSCRSGYPAKLAKLAKKGGMFVAHATKPDGVDGYWDESWNVYVAHTDGGAVKFDAIVVVLSEQSPD